jgi:hypothetical protein
MNSKKIYLFCFLFFSIHAQTQVQSKITIDWNENKKWVVGDYENKIPQFNPQNLLFKSTSGTIYYLKTIKSESYFSEDNLQISNVTLEQINESELEDLDKKNIPKELKISFQNYVARDEYSGQFIVTPIVRDNNVFKKVVSFEYTFTKTSNRAENTINNVMSVQNSVLATGNWYRFYVEKSGVYRLSKNFLQSLGFNTGGDPRTIKIYGNGGKMLPLSNAINYPLDLAENAIQVVGENDGVFNDQDYILFYAEGIDNWDEVNKTHLNLYAKRSYYYVTSQGGNGKRIQDAIQSQDPATTVITTFNDSSFYEKDLINIGKVGRIWFGEQFNTDNEQEFIFSLPNVTSDPAEIIVHAATSASVVTRFNVKVNNNDLGDFSFASIGSSGYQVARECNSGAGNCFSLDDQFVFRKSFTPTENITVKLSYDNNGVPSSKGYLDFIRINSKRNLTGYGKQFRFEFQDANNLAGIGEYRISNASTVAQVWDITDIYNVSAYQNGNQTALNFKVPLGESRKYIAVDINDYFTPLKESNARVANQDLKGTVFRNNQGQFQDVDYIIVTPKFLFPQAEKLANFHRNYSQLNVKVVDLEAIYQEFGSGKQDIAAIRNFVKYVYFNASSSNNRIKYLNLFGDASYDFKDRISNNTNVVPIFQALDSYSEGESSYCSDDFYGSMDSNEGNPSFDFFPGIDVAVGRMIVNNNQQADDMVNKVLEYHDIKSYGSWRNNIIAIADDGDKPSDAQLQDEQNDLIDEIILSKPFLNYKKILMDSYVQQTSAGGNRYPKVREDLFSNFEKGALVFNYLGHGGEDGLSQERIWEKSDGQNLANQFRYPLFVTITCDFSKFDNPSRQTAGEFTYWNPKGGAISMITTVRLIGQLNAQNFNKTFADYLFPANTNNYPSIAEALRRAKNFSPNSATNVVFYLGDPALMLAIPKPKIVLTKVNDIPITQPIPDLQSLALVKISGEVLDENNNQLPNYNGELSVNIYDKQVIRTTLNNDNNSPPINFQNLGETIFRGNATITNGNFEFSFVVPRDIRIPVGNGKISFYSKRNQIKLDRTGHNTDIKIGGINQNAAQDNTAPRVKLYMNDEAFVNGGITNESPFFLALLEDENGINTASGIGHDIIGILDGDESNPFIMNDYYQTELDDYTRGRVRFPYRNLAPGLHTISFRAWDVYNNPINAEIQFVVVGDESITLTNVLNYPNPFVNYTEFWFSHNRPFEPLEVQVQVMTITGKIVWTKNQIITTEGFLSRDIIWDGKDDFGDRIGKGTYVYKLTVKSTLSNKKAEKIEKLVIL